MSVTRENLNDLLNFLCITGRARILEKAGLDSCILSTKVGIHFLRYFGYYAEPQVVKLTVMNREALQAIEQEIPPQKALEMGAHVIQVDTDGTKEGNSWNGHLVFTVEDRLVDLTLDATSRVRYNMHLTPLAVEHHEFPTMFTAPDGSTVLYENDVPQKGFKDAPDWRQKRHWQPLVAGLIREYNNDDIVLLASRRSVNQ